ncbi:MAG: 60S ribosomal protein L31 [archaeon GB-1867-005]|nr:60S ribosomal protein L31 [Candidatus Culexmicrobium cathedralense]
MSSDKEQAKIVEERIYVVPFRIAFFVPRPKRVPRAIRFLRSFIKRHMKTENVWISPEVNEVIWSRGKKKPPRKIKVRAVKEEDGMVRVYLAEL